MRGTGATEKLRLTVILERRKKQTATRREFNMENTDEPVPRIKETKKRGI